MESGAAREFSSGSSNPLHGVAQSHSARVPFARRAARTRVGRAEQDPGTAMKHLHVPCSRISQTRRCGHVRPCFACAAKQFATFGPKSDVSRDCRWIETRSWACEDGRLVCAVLWSPEFAACGLA